MPTRSLALAVLAALAPVAAAQSVWVVDPLGGPGADFTALAPAVDAAAPGDVLVLRGVSFGALVLDGKGLTVVADEGFEPFLFGQDGPGVLVRNLPAGQSVVVRGCAIERNALVPGPKLEITACSGAVWLEHCRTFVAGAPAARVEASADVVLHACEFRGTDGTTFGAIPPSPALVAVDARIALHGSTIHGGNGRPATVDSDFALVALPQPGAPAIVMAGGELYAADGLVRGGAGGNGVHDLFGCIDPEAGGAGLVLDAAPGGGAPSVALAGATVAGGAGGSAFVACTVDAPAGPAQLVLAGAVATHPIAAPSFSTTSPAREGDTITLAIDAPPSPSQFAALLLGTAPTSLPLAPDLGVALVVPAHVLPLGALPPSGVLAVPVAVPSLVAPTEAAVLYLQSLVCDIGGCALGAATQLVIVDAAL